jgi:hypothetical protein
LPTRLLIASPTISCRTSNDVAGGDDGRGWRRLKDDSMITLSGADDRPDPRPDPAEEPGKGQQPVFLVENTGAVAPARDDGHGQHPRRDAAEQSDPETLPGPGPDMVDLHHRPLRHLDGAVRFDQQLQGFVRKRQEPSGGRDAGPIGNPEPFTAIERGLQLFEARGHLRSRRRRGEHGDGGDQEDAAPDHVFRNGS